MVSPLTSTTLSPCSACGLVIDSAVPSACTPATNTYSLVVTISVPNPPAGEDITFTTSNGFSQTVTPLGSNPETFTLTGLTADGMSDIDLTATYQTTTTCTNTLTDAFDSPPSCTGCPTGDCGSTTVSQN